MKTSKLVKRIEALEAKAAAKGPWRSPELHIIYGASKSERDANRQAMIDRGNASPGDIFFMVVTPGEKLI